MFVGDSMGQKKQPLLCIQFEFPVGFPKQLDISNFGNNQVVSRVRNSYSQYRASRIKPKPNSTPHPERFLNLLFVFRHF